jgi:hypothetical protein
VRAVRWVVVALGLALSAGPAVAADAPLVTTAADVVAPSLDVFPTGTPCSFTDDFGAPRGTDASGNPLYHEGNDVIASIGTPIYAVKAGTVSRLSQSVKGGNQLYLTLDDGTYFFHAHIDHYADGITAGTKVTAGQVIAYVGQTGDAQYTIAHLHFEVHPQGGAPIDPYLLLKAVDPCHGGVPSPPSPPPTGPSGNGYGGLTTITPVRFADTRSNLGMTPFTAMTVNTLTIAGYRGVPSDTQAVRATVTVTAPAAAGYLTVWPCGSGVPATSILNFDAGQTVANSTLVGLGSGRLCLRASTKAQVLVDITGWQAAGGALGFAAVASTRLVDTRTDHTRLPAGGTLTVTVTDPAAHAISANITAVDPAAAGYLTAYPCDAARPTASNLNYLAHRTVASGVTVGLGAPHTFCVFSLAATDVLVDLTGVWTSGAGAKPTAIEPVRVLDTRTSGTRLVPGAVTRVAVAGVAGLPTGIAGVATNITVTAPRAAGYVTAWSCDGGAPVASTLNFAAGATVANSATLPLTDGALCATSSTPTDLVVDVTGTLS